MVHRLGIHLLVTAISIVIFGALGCAPPNNAEVDAGPDEDTNVVDEEPAKFEAYFTQPQPDEPDESIEEQIIEALQDVPSNAAVRAAFYTFGRDQVAEAFAQAYDRGVDVQIVLGNTSTTSTGRPWSAVEILIDRLGEDRVTICQEGEDEGGCMGTNIHHNKFITFSELGDGTRDVVLQTSSNMTSAQLEQFNNMVVAYDDAALHDAFSQYWDDLRRDERLASYNREEWGDNDSRVFFFPLSSGDPIMDVLERVDCDGGAQVYLAMAFFTDTRVDVAERLRELDSQGCGVNIALRERHAIGSPGDSVLSALQSGDINFGMFPDNAPVQLHSKYLLVDGSYGRDREERRLIWTGSHNYTRAALRDNDEVLLKIDDDTTFEAYLDDWNHIRDRAATVHP